MHKAKIKVNDMSGLPTFPLNNVSRIVALSKRSPEKFVKKSLGIIALGSQTLKDALPMELTISLANCRELSHTPFSTLGALRFGPDSDLTEETTWVETYKALRRMR